MLAPIAIGDLNSLNELRRMADTGEAWPMLDGAGRNYGAYVITALDETQKSIMDNGVPRISDFSLSLQRMDDPRLDAEPTA